MAVGEPPVPICINILREPVALVLTPLNITVIRSTQLGIPVKSITVPLVEATAVPFAIPSYTAPEFVVTPAEPFSITGGIYYPYSYIMLIVPASKVSVPLTVVMRTLSNTPLKVTPPAMNAFCSTTTLFVTPLATHIFEPIKLN